MVRYSTLRSKSCPTAPYRGDDGRNYSENFLSPLLLTNALPSALFNRLAPARSLFGKGNEDTLSFIVFFMKQKLHTADLVFDPTLACWSFRYPGVPLSLPTLSN